MSVIFTSLTDLPDDVLFQIFSYLPLKGVLRLEHLCQRLQLTITMYLSTVKTLNLYSQYTTQDIFRRYDEAVMKPIHPCILKKLLSRCKLVQSIVFIPSSLQASFCAVIRQFMNIRHIQFVDCKDILAEVRAQNVSVSLGEVCIASSVLCTLTSTVTPTYHTYRSVSTLCVEGIIMDAQALFFSNCVEMSLIRCNLEVTSNSELSTLEFPNLSKFVYVELPGRSASSRVGVVLVKKVTAGSEKLKVLHVGLSEFSALEVAVSGWKATQLKDLQVVSTGSYSASLQQLRYASIIANVCHFCRATLQRISLPSSILIKRFFGQLISANSHFQQLRTLQVMGIADTKMFLPPGNMVETFSYQEFLKLCPMMSSLSLHYL